MDDSRLPRPASFIAASVTEARAAAGSRATSATLDHVACLATRLPIGTRARPVLGGNVLRALVSGLDLAIRRRFGTREGTALGLLTMLWEAGLVVLPGPPNRKSAGPAMARLAELTPLLQVIVRGRYRLYAGDPAFHPEWLANAITCSLMRDASAPKTPADARHFDASASGADLTSTPVLGSSFYKERVRGETSHDPSSASDGEAQSLAPGCPGAAAGSSSTPAEGSRQSPATSPARVELEPLVISRSAWLAAIPLRFQIQRAAKLVLEHMDGPGMRGTATTVAGWLARYEPDASARSRAALARALRSLIRLGLLVESDGWIRLPAMQTHPALELVDLPEQPQVRRPSEKLAAKLERHGISARGLGHDEAVKICGRLWSRAQTDRAHPLLLARVIREQQRADLDVDLRRLGRLDRGAARRALESAMQGRLRDEQRWGEHA